jgi:hypothetical protein
MLTAMSVTETQVIAWETSRNDGPFRCPECGYQVILKAGQKKIHHFAHAPGANCEFGSGETEEHMRIKRELYETLLKAPACKNWAMERRVFDGVVRPDLSGRINNIPIVIEVQRSNTTVETVSRRFQEYSRRGIAMLWVLTKSPANGSSTLGDWKEYLNLIYQGVLYIHNSGSKVNLVKCDYNSWTVRTYHTETIGTADIVKDFEIFRVNAINDEKCIFEGGLVWCARQVGKMLFDDAIEEIKDQRNYIWMAVRDGQINECNNLIDGLKEYIDKIQIPESQARRLSDYLSTFAESCDRDRRNVVANAQAKLELETRLKAEREEWNRQATIKWEEERSEREVRYKRLAEEAAVEWFAARERLNLLNEAPLTPLEIQEKAEREMWKAEKARQSGEKLQKNQVVESSPSHKEIWRKLLDEQNASADAWEKKKAKQSQPDSASNQREQSSQKQEDKN